ncbi:MAG: hypothetical protein M3361_05785, partial [Candidatus Tectomicrobia bacterium]|nr:hypothetical protein [Candidatus Tectomicrobia bacterium]
GGPLAGVDGTVRRAKMAAGDSWVAVRKSLRSGGRACISSETRPAAARSSVRGTPAGHKTWY